jgi:hypothetical protein
VASGIYLIEKHANGKRETDKAAVVK